MTIYGWDASHHDWGRGTVDVAAAVRDGISFMTHKIGEARTVTDDRYDDFYRKSRGVVPLLGAYYVNHPGDQNYQADRMLSMLDARAPGWRDGPFILQVDAEKFDYMDRAPNKTECKAFCDRLVSKTGGQFRPVLYAPKWLYGDGLTGVGYPLWASNYGTNPVLPYRQAYTGDGSTRWVAYSGQTPAILQYGSRTKIGTQNTCDANAYRGTLAQLRALVYRASPPPSPSPEPEGDKMLLIKTKDNATVWRSDGIQRVAMTRNVALQALVAAGHKVVTVDDLGDLEDAAGPLWTPLVDVDTAAVVAGILAGLTPQAIAAAVAAALPADLAQEVADLIPGELGDALRPRN